MKYRHGFLKYTRLIPPISPRIAFPPGKGATVTFSPAKIVPVQFRGKREREREEVAGGLLSKAEVTDEMESFYLFPKLKISDWPRLEVNK